MGLTRRQCLRLLGAGGLGLAAGCTPPSSRAYPAAFVDPDPARGHALRRPRVWDEFAAAAEAPYDAIVIGGGVAGVSACWKLRRAGVQRLLLIELADQLGGTSRGAADGRSPWGAHYINLPPQEADCIHEVLVDLGVIEGYDAAGRPLPGLEHVLRWPHERLHQNGAWVEGLDAFAGAADREPLRAFEDEMLRWTLYRGRDGRRAFAMPLLYSSADEAVRQLDQMTMAAYLRGMGWQTPQLDWLVDYACRDDYGSRLDQVSAWAGIHYYACRYYDYRLQDRYPSDTLTWPQGNAFLVEGLARGLGPDEILTDTACLKIRQTAAGVEVATQDLTSGRLQSRRARTVVYAGKLHTVPFVIDGLAKPRHQAFAALNYSTWLVAAVHVSGWDQPTAWDNVLGDGPSLGYVMADHQTDKSADRTLVYYLPFADDDQQVRQRLLEGDAAYWSKIVAADLLRVHPDLAESIRRIDLYRWGHAMVRPEPGVLWGSAAALRRQPLDAVFFAGCDVTGLPLFEEACFSGILAAEGALKRLAVAAPTSLGGLPDVWRV